MKFSALCAGLCAGVLLSGTALVQAAGDKDKPVLKDDVEASVRSAIESAQEANGQAAEAGLEWFWAQPSEGLWEGANMDNGKILDQAIAMANEGRNEEARKAAAFVESCAGEAMASALKNKGAGPEDYF
ncbi:MAG: hypothetical protein KDI44_07550 [Thiothrix sp.]|nr:hypothetical protein [Thiothrix sp.]HPQ96468.1 hypothetical protein [Thiolinea sp.]